VYREAPKPQLSHFAPSSAHRPDKTCKGCTFYDLELAEFVSDFFIASIGRRRAEDSTLPSAPPPGNEDDGPLTLQTRREIRLNESKTSRDRGRALKLSKCHYLVPTWRRRAAVVCQDCLSTFCPFRRSSPLVAAGAQMVIIICAILRRRPPSAVLGKPPTAIIEKFTSLASPALPSFLLFHRKLYHQITILFIFLALILITIILLFVLHPLLCPPPPITTISIAGPTAQNSLQTSAKRCKACRLP